MKPITDILYGRKAADTQPQNLQTDDIRIRNAEGKWFSMNRKDLSTGLLCIGGTGSGKTNAIKWLLQDIRENMTEDDVMVIFDTKGDFLHAFRRPGDIVLGAEDAPDRAVWNIYREVLAESSLDKAEMSIEEISRSLFKPYESTQQPFFANAARGIFSAYLTAMVRSAQKDSSFAEKRLNNEELKRYFRQLNQERLMKLANLYQDLRYIRLYVGDGSSNQALGVLAELQLMVQDCFMGSFAGKGDFGVRDFIRGKGGRTLFIEYDISVGETFGPVYSLLIDLALKEALSRPENSPGSVYVVLDELKLAPHLSHLDDAVNFGRSKGVKLVAGLQAISQLYASYGKDTAVSTIAGFGSLLAFKPNDAMTREYLCSYFGQCMTREIYHDADRSSERRIGCCVEDWELREMLPGDAFVGIAQRDPYAYHFPLWEGL